jgi:hypothetical protein
VPLQGLLVDQYTDMQGEEQPLVLQRVQRLVLHGAFCG